MMYFYNQEFDIHFQFTSQSDRATFQTAHVRVGHIILCTRSKIDKLKDQYIGFP